MTTPGMLGGVIFATYFLFYYLPGGFFYRLTKSCRNIYKASKSLFSAVITASFILGSKVMMKFSENSVF